MDLFINYNHVKPSKLDALNKTEFNILPLIVQVGWLTCYALKKYIASFCGYLLEFQYKSYIVSFM